MDLSNIKMVVTDMDGTLLNSKHEVSPRFFELFRMLHEKGIHFVAASGRQYNNILSKLEAIKEHITIIAENGGLVMYRDKEIISTPLDTGSKNKVLHALESTQDTHPVLCGKNQAYITNKSTQFESKLQEYYTKYEVITDLRSYEGLVMKIAIYHFDSSEKYIYPAVKHFEDSMKVKVSGANWVDVSHRNAHKGFALNKLMEMHKLNANEVLVFGDYNNDIEMLKLSNYSFAMANAHPNVMEVAKFRTLSNDEFGVESILEHLV